MYPCTNTYDHSSATSFAPVSPVLSGGPPEAPISEGAIPFYTITIVPLRVQLQPHLAASELQHHYQHAQDRVEARRWHLLHLVAQQWTVKQAAQSVGLNYDYAKEIIRRYNQEGMAGIKNRSQQGQPSPRSLLTPAQQQELQQALRHDPPEGGSWSGPKVARWIAAKTGKQVWNQRGWDYLQRLRS